MFKNSLGRNPRAGFSLGVLIHSPGLLSCDAATSWCEIEGYLWSRLGNVRSYLNKGDNFVTCLPSSLCPLVWSKHDPKMSGGVWWRAMETWPHHYRNFIVVACGGAKANPLIFWGTWLIFSHVTGKTVSPVLLIPLLAETPLCGPLEKLLSFYVNEWLWNKNKKKLKIMHWQFNKVIRIYNLSFNKIMKLLHFQMKRDTEVAVTCTRATLNQDIMLSWNFSAHSFKGLIF